MEFGIIPLPFGQSLPNSQVEMVVFWLMAVLVNLLGLLGCMTKALELQRRHSDDWGKVIEPNYNLARVWVVGGFLMIPGIYLYHFLGVYLLVGLPLIMLTPFWIEIAGGLLLVGLLVVMAVYSVIRTAINPKWH